ncbi:hypothetical protein ACIQMJ_28270 [Actinosynnema sp. NPDC091369]
MPGPELLINGSFEKGGPKGFFTSTALDPATGTSAASAWYTKAAGHGSVLTTSLLPTTYEIGNAANARMIHVATTAPNTGLVQVFTPAQPVARAKFTVRVFIVQGSVAIGVGNGGSTGATAFGDVVGTWLTLTGGESTSPVTEIVIYSGADPFADFYVDFASVTEKLAGEH